MDVGPKFSKIYGEWKHGLDVRIQLGTNNLLKNGWDGDRTWEDLMRLIERIEDQTRTHPFTPNTFCISGLLMSPRLAGQVPWTGWTLASPNLGWKGKMMIKLNDKISAFNSMVGAADTPRFTSLGFRTGKRYNCATLRWEFGKELKDSDWRKEEQRFPWNILHPIDSKRDFMRQKLINGEFTARKYLGWIQNWINQLVEDAVSMADEHQARLPIPMEANGEEEDHLLELHMGEDEIDALLAMD